MESIWVGMVDPNFSGAAMSGMSGMPSGALGGSTTGATGAGGINLGGLGAIMNGIGSLGQIYMAIKSLGLANDQFDFTKKTWNTNLKNQTKSYNTNLREQKIAEYSAEGRTEQEAKAWYQKNKL